MVHRRRRGGDGVPRGPAQREGAVLSNPRARRMVDQVLGSAYIDDWRVLYVNKEAIDPAAEALLNQGGELVGDEVAGMLDSVGLATAADPYPDEMPVVPDRTQSVAESA